MKISQADFVALLDEIRTAVAAGDSWEGRISYSAMDADLQAGEFRVEGAYRIGNLHGQGGVRLIKADAPAPAPAPDAPGMRG